MTIIEAIAEVDSLVPNVRSREDKVRWLSRLDWTIKKEILDNYPGTAGQDFNGYDQNTDLHTTLLVPPPYDEIYLRWLEAQIHFYNGETERYNEAIIMYNDAMSAYSDHYNRTHKPRGQGQRFLF